MLHLPCNVCARSTQMKTMQFYVTCLKMLHLTQTQSIHKLRLKKQQSRNGKRAWMSEKGDDDEQTEGRGNYILLPRWMVIFGFGDGYFIEPVSKNYFCLQTVVVVCLKSCFFVDFVLKILFLKMPMHKIRKQKSEIFSFSFSLSKLCSVRYSSDNFFKQTQA